LETPYRASERLERIFGYEAESWQEANANSLSLFVMQNMIANFVIGSILIVGGFGILAIQIMIVLQKQRDIAILRSVGFRRSDILSIFLLQGVIVSLLGGASRRRSRKDRYQRAWQTPSTLGDHGEERHLPRLGGSGVLRLGDCLRARSRSRRPAPTVLLADCPRAMVKAPPAHNAWGLPEVRSYRRAAPNTPNWFGCRLTYF
jgi:hypothetical protein